MDVYAFEAGSIEPVAAANHSIIVDSDVQRQNVNSGGNLVLRSPSKENFPTDRLVVPEEAAAAAAAAGSEHVVAVV